MTARSRAIVSVAILAACALGATGCATDGGWGLQVYGDDGQGFSARVEGTGGQLVRVGTVLRSTPQQILQTDSAFVSCDISKDEESARLVAEVLRRGQVEARAEAPPGTAGVRLTRVDGRWRTETY